MSGFLQRLLERTHGSAQAPLRRRRPSLFEGRQAAPPLVSATDAGPAASVPVPISPDSTPRGVHTREIHHRQAMAEPVARRARRDPTAATPAPTPVAAEMALLPTPPALRPLSMAAPPPAIAATPSANAQAPLAPMARRARANSDTEPVQPAGTAPRRRMAPEAIDVPAPRRTRPAAAPRADADAQPQRLPLPPRLAVSQRAAAPVAHPARRAALPAPATAPVQVSIGSVEIRAQATAPTPERARPRPSSSSQVPSLDAYLRQRHGGPR
ncbi:MAG TPA: hypothetical protein VM687_08225 [Stenotrophomonas sp.]|nr:hypothetical protein [Stenotrophomonas sp.]